MMLDSIEVPRVCPLSLYGGCHILGEEPEDKPVNSGGRGNLTTSGGKTNRHAEAKLRFRRGSYTLTDPNFEPANIQTRKPNTLVEWSCFSGPFVPEGRFGTYEGLRLKTPYASCGFLGPNSLMALYLGSLGSSRRGTHPISSDSGWGPQISAGDKGLQLPLPGHGAFS